MIGVQAGCPRRQGLISGRGKRLQSFPSVCTGSGVHPVSFQMDTDGSFPWVKVAWGVGGVGDKADHSPSSAADIKNL